MRDDPDHPIIDRPWEYHIAEFVYHVDPVDPSYSYIDLHLRRGQDSRRLRFLGPQSLRIEEGFPASTLGMRILDVRARQFDGLGVWVLDDEATNGSVVFWAREVIDLRGLKPSFRRGDRVVMLRHAYWKRDAVATVVRSGRVCTIFDGTIRLEYFIRFDEPQDDLDSDTPGWEYTYEGTTVLEEYLRPIDPGAL